MGNVAVSCVQLRRRLPAVEERLTRPRRLVRELPDLDAGRLRRLIRGGDLAPCFDPSEDAGDDGLITEECPICFFFYPSLNRSKCCGKGICTECFLQLMPSKTSKVVHCPFCKTKAYAIEYQGAQMTSGKKIKEEAHLLVERAAAPTLTLALSRVQTQELARALAHSAHQAVDQTPCLARRQAQAPAQDLSMALAPALNRVRGLAPAPGRRPAMRQEVQDHRPRQARALNPARLPPAQARTRAHGLAQTPVLARTPARAQAPGPAPALTLTPLEPGHLAGLARRPAQRPTQAALGSVRVLVGPKGLEHGRGSEWAAAEGSELEPVVETPVGRSSIRFK